MPYKVFVFVVIACFFVLSSAMGADDALSPSDPGWVEKTGGKDYRTYLRYREGAETAEVLMVGKVTKSPKDCLAVVTSYAAFPEFMPYIKLTRLLSTEKISEEKSVNTVFFYVEAPLVSPRFYTLRLVDEKNPVICQSTWDLEKGPRRKTPSDISLKGAIKDPEKAVETPLNKGFWRFTALSGGRGTKVEYYVFTNPGGKIPPFIVNRSNAIALPLLWKSFKERLGKKP